MKTNVATKEIEAALHAPRDTTEREATGMATLESCASEALMPGGAAPGRDLPLIRITYMIDHLWHVEGGGEQVLLRTLRHLPRHRFRPSVVTFNAKSRSREILQELKCPLYVFPIQCTYGWSGLKAALAIRRILREEHSDIVHTFFETSNTWGGLVTKLSFGPALVSSRRDMGVLRSSKHRLVYNLVNVLSDRVQTVSNEVRRLCIENEAINPEKVFTIYNGVDLALADLAEARNSFREEHGLDSASHLVTTIANIRRIKGLDTLIEAAAIVRRQFPSILFVIAGAINEPGYFEELKLLVKDLALEQNIQFLGVVHDVFPLLKASDLFCLPSRTEGFSNALLEAMACGLPCVATRVGGNPEAIIHGENGYLVPSDDPAATANFIISVLDDPETAMQLGRAARKTVISRFTVDHMIAQLVQFYEALVRSRA